MREKSVFYYFSISLIRICGMNNEVNHVFIIDLDGTIIGDCIFQAELYKIYLILGKLGIKIKIDEILKPHYTDKSKLIRPYFLEFIKQMRDNFMNCHFYVYTASEKKWAEKQIKIIEENLKMKFNRPIFTRNECEPSKDNGKLTYIKSINRIKRRIKLDNIELMIIDDKQVYMDNSNLLVRCNLYNYRSFCNYWDYIPINKIKNKVFLEYLSTLIKENRLTPVIKATSVKQKMEYYKWLYNKCKELNEYNKGYRRDDFWLNLAKIISKNKIRVFNDKSLNLIKRSL
jgi:hypothetical protein